MGKWFKLQPGTLKPHKMMDYSTWFEFQVCPHVRPHSDICSWWAQKHIGCSESIVLQCSSQGGSTGTLCFLCMQEISSASMRGLQFFRATGGGFDSFSFIVSFCFSSRSVMGNLSAMAWWNQNSSMLCNNNEKDTDWQAWHYGLQSAQSSPWQTPKDASSVCGGTFRKSF